MYIYYFYYCLLFFFEYCFIFFNIYYFLYMSFYDIVNFKRVKFSFFFILVDLVVIIINVSVR